MHGHAWRIHWTQFVSSGRGTDRASFELIAFSNAPERLLCSVVHSSGSGLASRGAGCGLAFLVAKTRLHDTMVFWKQIVRMQLHKRLNARELAPRARFELATLRLPVAAFTFPTE